MKVTTCFLHWNPHSPIYESRSARFDGKDLPAPGMEPFNADPEDVRKAWEL